MSFSPTHCPATSCPSHSLHRKQFIKKGFFRIKRSNQYIRRFQCKVCLRTFSSRSFQADCFHKKPDLNFRLAHLLVEGSSLRSCSRVLGMTYKNTYRKFLWLQKVIELKRGKLKFTATTLQFDELESIHHTKCKPLSIALMVNEKHELLGAQVAEMPAKGRLAAFSRQKYGIRKDERPLKLEELFRTVKASLMTTPLVIESDQKPGYEKYVREFFPKVNYEQHNSADRVKLQERMHEKLNKKRFDPLFAVNHQCALLRSHIKRLTRRSWCTTKKIENLQLHLDLFILMQFVVGTRFEIA